MINIEKDIRLTYGQLLSRKDAYNLAKHSNEFWIHKYPDSQFHEVDYHTRLAKVSTNYLGVHYMRVYEPFAVEVVKN